LRREQPVFRRRHFLVGAQDGSGVPDVSWYAAGGAPMREADWGSHSALAVFLNGDDIPSYGRRGERLQGDSFLLLVNAHDAPVQFTLPPPELGARWAVELTTGRLDADELAARDAVATEPRSVAVLRRL
jgi:glycogen operon protein